MAMAITPTARIAMLDRRAARGYGFAPIRSATDNERTSAMTRTRIVLTGFVGLLVEELLAVLIHGFVLAPDYEPYYGTLLRGGESPAWQFAFLPLAHLSFVGALV